MSARKVKDYGPIQKSLYTAEEVLRRDGYFDLAEHYAGEARRAREHLDALKALQRRASAVVDPPGSHEDGIKFAEWLTEQGWTPPNGGIAWETPGVHITIGDSE